MTSLATKLPLTHQPQAVLRLTALWAVVESGLGGVLHAFKVPLTGLLVGGSAVLLITLIAHFAERPREILRATLLVLIVKALVSPHSPIGAYLAVSFQGGLGFLVYSLGRPGFTTSLPYATAAMLESALQKLLMLVLFFGKPFWEAVDGYGSWVVKRFFPGYVDADWSLSWTLVAGYVGVYAVGGLLIGGFAARLPQRLETQLRAMSATTEMAFDAVPEKIGPKRKKRSKTRRLLWWLALAVVLGVTVYFGERETQPLVSATLYLTRTLAIVLAWYFLVGPWLARLFRGWLLGKQGRYAEDLGEVMDLLPGLRQVARREFALLSEELSGVRLYLRWLLRVVALSLTVRLTPKPVATPPAHD